MIKEPKPFIFPKYKTMKQFKPYDKVLRKGLDGYWTIDMFSYLSKTKYYYCLSGSAVKEQHILSYEGNEYLLGTTNEPEEEIILLKEGERIVCSDYIDRLLNGHGLIETFSEVSGCGIYDSEDCPWDYCIPFSQFKEKNTKHDILCVRNNKLVRYEKSNN